MKIINIGILAHVDAGKTTLTESLLYTSGAIMEPGSVDKGTTRTDSMALERQRKITNQAAVTSFRWKGYKVNLVDTPGHMDFLTEVHRSLSVLDGAILVVSAKDGVQAQTRVLFHALRKMKIPTIIFINKIDQSGVVLEQTYQNIREKLTEDMMVMQEVHLFSELTLSDVADFEKWDAVIAGDLTTLAAYCDSWDEGNFDLLLENYRRQIRGLIDGGADLLIGETLLYPHEAEAILTAAELEGAGASMYSFTMQSDGSLFSGRDAGPVLKSLEDAGAAAVGFNCVAADMMTPHLVFKLRRYVKGPLLCKPNAGVPVIGADKLPHYGQTPAEFAAIVRECHVNGADLLGGCCGTAPEYISYVRTLVLNRG